MEQRFDRAGGLASPKSATIFEGRAARVHRSGDPLRYPQQDGSTQLEYRDANELAALAKRLSGKPVTLGHGGKIVGTVMSARVDGDHCVAEMAIHDDQAATAIRDGSAGELSLGYTANLDNANYQRDVNPFELALVEKARCGATCSTRGDCAGECTCGRADNVLNAAARAALPAHDFAVPEREGLPLHDEGHLKAAMARFGEYDFQSASEKRAAYHKIVGKAKALGIDASGFISTWSGRLDEETGRIAAPHAESTVPLQPGIVTSMLTEDQVRALNQQVVELDAKVKHLDVSLATKTKEAEAHEATAATYKKQLDAAVAQRTDERAVLEADAVKREKARADALQVKVDEHAAKFDAAVQSRGLLLAKASAVLGLDAKIAEHSDRAIRCAMIKKLDSTEDVSDTRADAAIEAVCNVLYKDFVEGARSTARASEAIASGLPPAERRDAATAQPAIVARKDQWRLPLPSSRLREH